MTTHAQEFLLTAKQYANNFVNI